METWTAIFLPFGLLMARIAGFFAVLPIFGWRTVPMRVRAGVSLIVTVFFAMIMPPPAAAMLPVVPLAAAILMTREALCGLALGMAANIVFRSVQLGAKFAGRQMGFAMASVIDPSTGEQGAPVGMFFEITFMALFLAARGHHLLLLAIRHSFRAFPIGAPPRTDLLVGGIIKATTAMLTFGMKLAAPVLAAFVVLSVILGVLARVLPEMNILMMSFPLRVGLGLLMAAAICPMMNDFTIELAQWMGRFLVS